MFLLLLELPIQTWWNLWKYKMCLFLYSNSNHKKKLAGGIQTDDNICISQPANLEVRLSIVVGRYQWCLSRELLGSLFTPFTRSVDHVLRLQSWRFWPLLSEQHGSVDGWRERDVDGSTASMLASKEKAESKLSAQLNKLSSSSQSLPEGRKFQLFGNL